MTNWGSDVSSFVVNDEGVADLDPYFRIITGPRVVAEAVARRWTSPHGSLFWDPDAGQDVRDRLNAKLDPSQLDELAASLAAEAEKDERVLRCGVLVTYEQASKRLRIRAAITLSDADSFEFVMSIDAVTAAVLGLEVSE